MRTVLQSISILAFAIVAVTAVAQPKSKSDWNQVGSFEWSSLMSTVSPNGMVAAVLELGDKQDHTLNVKSVPGGEILFSVPISGESIPLCFALNSYVVFSANSKKMAMVIDNICSDKMFSSTEIWDVETGLQIRVLEGGGKGDVSFNADGSRLLLPSYATSTGSIIDVATGDVVSTIQSDYDVYGSPNGDMIVHYSAEKVSKIYDFNGELLSTVSGYVKEFGLDGRYVGVFDNRDTPYNITIWDVEANNKSTTWKTDDPSGNYILAIYDNYGLFSYVEPTTGLSRLEMRDISSGDVIWTKEEYIKATIFEAAVSPDRSEIVIVKNIDSSGMHRRVVLQSINPSNGKVKQNIVELAGQDYKSVYISDVVYHGNNRLVASLWEEDGPKELVTYGR